MKKIFITSVLFILIQSIHLSANADVPLDIKQIPQIDFEATKTMLSIGEYNGKGLIDAVFPDKIVVNDSNLYFSSSLKLFTINGKIFSEELKKGMTIYYFLDQNRAVSKVFIDPGN